MPAPMDAGGSALMAPWRSPILSGKDVPYHERTGRRDHQQADEQGADHHPATGARALHLKAGDDIAYAIEDGRVVLSRVPAEPADNPLATFGEWSSDADQRAYADL